MIRYDFEQLLFNLPLPIIDFYNFNPIKVFITQNTCLMIINWTRMLNCFVNLITLYIIDVNFEKSKYPYKIITVYHKGLILSYSVVMCTSVRLFSTCFFFFWFIRPKRLCVCVCTGYDIWRPRSSLIAQTNV